MLRIDNNLLQEVGLGTLPDSEKNSLLRHIYETLEMRVGIRLADQMSNEQLDEFERYFEAKDDAGAFKWLETNFPNYKEIVQEEFDKLKAEVAQSAPQILSSSAPQAQPQQDPQFSAQSQAPPLNAQPPVDSYAAQPPPMPATLTPNPTPMPPVQRDINMPTPAPQFSPSAGSPGSSPQYSPSPASSPFADPAQPPNVPGQPMPPFPNQQPPAGPGSPFQQ